MKTEVEIIILTIEQERRAEEMAQWHTLLLQRIGVTSQHTCWVVQTSCNSSSRGPNALFWPL